jgi:hypothetical protein
MHYVCPDRGHPPPLPPIAVTRHLCPDHRVLAVNVAHYDDIPVVGT